LAESIRFYTGIQVLLFTLPAITRYQQLLQLKLNVGKMDLRIGATALEHGAVVVTRNLRDFRRIPNLTAEDWSV
jgi:tRNA(fMet)-specific endonuclease VapC